MTVLVVAAHPDDEVLGCGATISRLASEGQEVVIAILGEGATSRSANRDVADVALVDGLADRAREVGTLLGAAEVRLFGLPDNRFDSVDLLDVVKIVEGIVDDLRPAIILTHHGGDLNVDHGITHRAVLTATRPVAGAPVMGIYAFEVPSATEWAFHRQAPAFQPGTFVDVEGFLGRKIDGMAIYETEGRPFPHPRSPEALTAIARRWGSVVGCQAAEAFELVRRTWDDGSPVVL
jgi:LmbE family N-acetylglucosaminyl deacetylase